MVGYRHKIEVYPFSYNKILGGKRKIDIRPYKKNLHNLHIGDMIEYVNLETHTVTLKEVKGIALFNDFETLIKMLDPKLIGYDTREEIEVRVERMYSKDEISEYGVCAIFIDEPHVKHVMNLRCVDRSA